MKQATLTNLAFHGFKHGRASASGGKWRALFTHVASPRNHGNVHLVEIWHFNTHKVNITRTGTVTPVNPGWGSTTDRCGIRKITAVYNGHDRSVGYRELFEDAA